MIDVRPFSLVPVVFITPSRPVVIDPDVFRKYMRGKLHLAWGELTFQIVPGVNTVKQIVL